MPTEPSREDVSIRALLSAYEDGTWADALPEKPDAIDRTHPAVDWFATRRSDGKTLAIEHTIIEPFVGERKDFALFLDAGFLEIENDESLLVPGLSIRVFVPVGTLQNQSKKKGAWDAIVRSVHGWIKSNRLALCVGDSQHLCSITGVPGQPPFDITLNLRVYLLHRGSAAEPGRLHVRRWQVDRNLGEVIEKALRKKLPKLVNTAADKRILLLERNDMGLHPQSMLHEIEKRRTSFPDLVHVDEIWIVETFFYETAFGGACLHFELYEKGNLVRSFTFDGETLVNKSLDGVGGVIQQ